jgi:tetratricopeptide (TPR) repeat protein
VRTWPETDVAVIKSKGFILGQVSLTERADRDDRQHVVITSKDPSEHLEPKRKWTLQPSAKPIQVGDLVCSLQGAAKPTIIRLCKDHFSVIRITAPPLQSEQPTINFPHEFLLLWDWEQSQGGLQDQEEYDMLVKSRVPKHSDTDLGCDLGKMTRLWNVGLILEYVERYKEAEERLREMMEGYESQVGEENLHTLVRKYKLALIYRKTKQWEEAKKLLEQVIQTRMQLQGTDHPDTNSSRADLASTYKDQGHLKGEKLEAMIGILERRGGNAQTTEKEVVEIARSFDEEVMRLLLDQRRGKVQITEDVVIAAAGNRWGGEIVMKLLLYQSSIDVPITEGAVVQIARLFSQETLRLLLDQRRNEVQITECVLIAAAEDWKTSENAMKLLLDWRWNEVQITEGVVTAAAGNRGQGERAMKLLLNWREKEARGFLRNQEGKGILVTAGAMTQIAICFDKEICDKAYKGERHATIECIK